MSLEILDNAGINELYIDDVIAGLENLEGMKLQLGDSADPGELKAIASAREKLLTLLENHNFILLGTSEI